MAMNSAKGCRRRRPSPPRGVSAPGSIIGSMLRFLTAGESHGPQLTVVIEGLPAGLAISEDDLRRDLARRQGGHGRGGRPKNETHFPRTSARGPGALPTDPPAPPPPQNPPPPHPTPPRPAP